MRFEKRNPLIWLYFFLSIFNIVFGSLFLKIFRRRNKRPKKMRIVLFGHKLNGNIKALLDYVNREKIKDVEISYITMDYSYYKQLRGENPKVRILSSEKLTDIIMLLNSDVIVSTHGSNIFFLIKKLKMKYPKFVDLWHGVLFKGMIPEDFKRYIFYDKIFASSRYFKEFYVNKWGFKNEQVVTTGWGRVDYYFNNTLSKKALLKKYKLDKNYSSIILIAPTWKQDNKNRTLFPFNKSAHEFLDRIEKIGKNKNVLFIFRTHVNIDYDPKQEYEHIKFFPQERFPLTYELLYITNILIADWSSISIDFLTLNRPIIYLDVPAPFKNRFTLRPEDRVGYMVSNLDKLEKTIIRCIDNPNEFSVKFSKRREKVIKKGYGNFLDGNSAKRYLQEIKKLIQE